MAQTLKNLSDESLMEYIQKNDHQAFSILVERRTEMFYAAAYRMVMNKHDAEDIVQDAFLKIWNRPHIWKNDNTTKFTTWFYRIVMNIAVDKFRKNSKENSVEIKDNILSDDRSQEQELLFDEEQKFLQGAMLALPEKQLMALNLCFYEGLSNKEAAEVMDINVKALESLLMRGKTKLKDYFYRQGFLKQEDVA